MTTVPYIVSVQFFGGPQPSQGPLLVEVTQEEFNHDRLEMTIWADDVNSDSYISGMPVQVVFGRPGNARSFFGYVNHAKRQTKRIHRTSLEDANSVCVYCVGASWPMKQTDNLSWASMTASQVVEQIAQQFGLRTSIVPHSVVWPTLQMAGMSYWQFCSHWAKKIGYTFYCNGVQLVFKPRNTDPTNMTGYVRSYDMVADPSSLPIFIPEIGVTSPSGGQLKNRIMGNVDPRTGNIFVTTVSGNPSRRVLGKQPEQPIFTEISHHSVQSPAEADAKLQGEALSNQLYMTADATSVGDASISQGSLVFVSNVNGAQNGLWFVESAVHCLDLKTYSLQMKLGRDSKGITTSINNNIPRTENPPKALLRSGSWVAA